MTRILSIVRARAVLLVGLLVAAVLVVVDREIAILALSLSVFGLVNTTDDVVKYLVKIGLLDAAGGYKKSIKAKTADYTILAASDPSSTVFTNRGATGAVIFTLPAAAAALAGVYYDFLGLADQNFTVLPAAVDTLVVVNDAAADSLAVSTAAHKIGACMRVVCDGAAWIAFGTSVGDTFTVAT